MKSVAIFYRVLGEFERAYLQKELERNQWNRARTARDLGISYRTLLYKIEHFDLTPPDREACPEAIPA
jgi:DNA-binding NtrC family response regulator